jgi:soluble lytic murein transglycosylase-like protein
MMVVQSGKGTLQFPVDQVDTIEALPDLPLPATPKVVPATNAVAGSEQLLIRAAIQEGLEPDFVRSVAKVESGLRQDAVSPKGALGLMQLMPQTAGQLGVDPNLAEQNALGGAAFLRQLLIQYKGDSALALAAYNAGPGAVSRFKGVPPYLETRRYVVKVLQEYEKQQRAAKSLQAKTQTPVSVTSPTQGQ